MAKLHSISSNEYYYRNKEKCALAGSLWAKNNPDKIREKNRKQYLRKRKEIIEKAVKRNLEKRKTDPVYRMEHGFSSQIRNALVGNKAGHSWERIVGYTLNQLKEHLEKQFKDGMNWNNYGRHGWHIDHIRPKSSFDYTSFEDENFKQCWSLDNLQPLWEEDNLRKGSKI